MATLTHGLSRTHALPVPPPWPYNPQELAEVEATVLYSEVARRDERDVMRPCLIRFLTENDVEALITLNDLVLARLSHPHILRSAGADYLQRNIAERGRCLGAFSGDQMIAFTVLTLPRDEPDNLAIDLGFERSERLRACHFELSGVHPEWRGNHLHLTMNEMRARFAGASGYYHLLGTVSPRNPYSLSNHFAGGMVVRKLTMKYGGMDRYIIYRDFRRLPRLPSDLKAIAVYCECLDIDRQKTLLANGYWGVAVEKQLGGGWRVAYVPRGLVGLDGNEPPVSP